MAGHWVARAVYAAARLGVADLLEAGPQHVEVLAKKANAHEGALYRLLRALASVGVFTETEPNTFSMTPKAELLCSDHPNSLRPLVLLWNELEYSAWDDIVHSIKTGECAFEYRTGSPFFDVLEKDMESARIFREAMAGASRLIPLAISEVYDFSGCNTIVDVGGSHGNLVSTILSTHPDLKGVIFDLPNVVESVKNKMGDEASRCEFAGGDFFESVPGGGDLYILSRIIHDWDDEHSIKILKNCRNAMGSDGKLLLVEIIIDTNNESSFGNWLDLHMLVMQGGSERTEAEYRRLLDAAGFELTRIIPTGQWQNIIEAVPASI
ncbi:MAG: methyltransferase [Gammaproteobacteria bacterium]|nr:methyltransferase [Gammaproteobacteria bacterium]